MSIFITIEQCEKKFIGKFLQVGDKEKSPRKFYDKQF